MSYIICFLCSQVINQKEPQTVRVHSFEGRNVSCNICFRSSGRSGPWILDVTWHKMLTVKFVCRNTFFVSHFPTIKTHTNEYLLKMNVLSDGSSLISLCLQFSFSVMHSDILHIHVQHNQQQSLLKPEMYRIISLALHEYTLDILNLQISFSPWLLLRLPFFTLALFENNSAFNILFVFGLLPCIGVISHPLFLSLCKGKMLYSVILTAWHCLCETVCPQHKACPRLPPLNVPFASANGHTVTVSDWTSCFFLSLSSILSPPSHSLSSSLWLVVWKRQW